MNPFEKVGQTLEKTKPSRWDSIASALKENEAMTEETKPTPGPWYYNRPHNPDADQYQTDIYIYGGVRPNHQQLICSIEGASDTDLANASLIASGHDLLAERNHLKKINAELAKALIRVDKWLENENAEPWATALEAEEAYRLSESIRPAIAIAKANLEG